MAEILSQEEINALLSSLSSSEGKKDERYLRGDAGRTEVTQYGDAVRAHAAASPRESPAVKPYDFRRPDKFAKDQLRTLGILYETFARQVSTSLAAYLRLPVTVSVTSVTQMIFDEFLAACPSPAVICMFSMRPLEGKAIAEVDGAIAGTVIDRLMGGTGEVRWRPRELTEIERTVLGRVLMRMLNVLQDTWASLATVAVAIEGIETEPQFAQVIAPGDTVALATLTVTVGGLSGSVNICMPYIMLQPLVPKLNMQQWLAEAPTRRPGDRPAMIRMGMEKVRVPVTVELGSATLPLRDMVGLEVGDCIKLDNKATGRLRILVGGLVKFLGRPGLMGRRLAVQVTDVVTDGGGTP